jgi:diamine N-acetyltransferase
MNDNHARGAPPPPGDPLPALLCPLCGRANECAVAAAGRFDIPCWCSGVAIDPAALARIAPADRGRACLCPACAGGRPTQSRLPQLPPATLAMRQPDQPVTLREITAETVLPVVRLSVAEGQKGFVATNAVSLAQALFAPEAWYRAIYFGEEIAGFVMLEDQSLRVPAPAKPEVGVWRFMVDERFQGRGIGRAALELVIAHVRAKGVFDELLLSYVPGPGCPEPFYRSLGFRPNGRMDGVEVVMALALR